MKILPQEIHLWFAYDKTINDTNLLSHYKDLLSEEERVQHQRFHFEKDRHQYLITRAMVRTVLSQYWDKIKPQDWLFERNEYGKPTIKNNSLPFSLHFNLSHSQEMIVLAVTLDREIGIDVEYLPRRGDVTDLAQRFFSPSEVDQLLKLPQAEQDNRFFDLWTLKEAYIKACGMGLSIPLDHFSYTISKQGEISISFSAERNDQPELWQFWQIHSNQTHKVSMAIKSEVANTNYLISMRNIAPFSTITEVDYRVTHDSL